jgi:hypothetical protein
MLVKFDKNCFAGVEPRAGQRLEGSCSEQLFPVLRCVPLARPCPPRKENLPAHRAALLRERDTAALILNPVKQNLATTINQNYVVQNQTSMIVWTGPPASSHISCSFSTIYDCVELLTASIGLPVIYAWYSIFPFAHPDGITVGGMGQ